MADFVEFMLGRGAVAEAYVSGDPAPLTWRRGGGAQRVLETNVAGSKHFLSGGESHLEVLQMKASGDLGFWTGLQHASVHVQGRSQPMKMSLRVTEVFRREEGDWKLVHRHADSLVEAAKGSEREP